MKTITISTENSETYSSISNFFIDYYMTEANGEFVKVYLYLVRLLSNNSQVTVASIADHFNLTENDICRAIKYWISKDVLKLNYDGRGRLNGIVLLPLHAPIFDMNRETDAISILNVTPEPEKAATIHEVKTEQQEKTSLTAPIKPNFTAKQLDAALQDTAFSDIHYLIETLFGVIITPTQCSTILYIYDSLKFSEDLFQYLVEYCVEMGKKSFRYMEAVAVNWYKDGITTRQEAKEQSFLSKGISKIVFKALGIRSRVPTETEISFINTWSKDYGFSDQLIKLACDKAILQQPSSANFSYVNAILESWHKNNVKTPDDVERLDQEYIAKRTTKPANSGRASNSINNFTQTKMDNQLAEMEELFLKEVNKL